MKFSYATSVRLCVERVKPEELAGIMSMVGFDDGHEPMIKEIHPDCSFDYYGCPLEKLGTYTVVFQTPWWDCEIKDSTKQQFETLKELEDSLTK